MVSKEKEPLVVLTMDNHLTSVITEIANELSTKCPGLSLRIFAASDWANDEKILDECKKAIKNARMIFVSMLFMEEHFKPILEDLKGKRDNLDALVCIMSSPEVTRLTKMGRLDMSKPASGVVSFLKRFRNKGKCWEEIKPAGEDLMRLLRSLPKILKYIPGTAQDLRVFFLVCSTGFLAQKKIFIVCLHVIFKVFEDKEFIGRIQRFLQTSQRVSRHWYLPSQDERKNF